MKILKNKSMKLDDLVDIINPKEFEFFNIQYTDEQDEVDGFEDYNISINNIDKVTSMIYGLSEILTMICYYCK